MNFFTYYLTERFWRTFKYSDLEGRINKRMDQLILSLTERMGIRMKLQLVQEATLSNFQLADKVLGRMEKGLMLAAESDAFGIVRDEEPSRLHDDELQQRRLIT